MRSLSVIVFAVLGACVSAAADSEDGRVLDFDSDLCTESRERVGALRNDCIGTTASSSIEPAEEYPPLSASAVCDLCRDAEQMECDETLTIRNLIAITWEHECGTAETECGCE